MSSFSSIINDILGTPDIIIALAAALFFLIVIPVIFSISSRSKRLEKRVFMKNLLHRIKWPLAISIAIVLIYTSSLKEVVGREQTTENILTLMLIAVMTWVLLSLVRIIKVVVHEKYPLDKEDNLYERKIRTQYQYIHALLSVIIVVIGIAVALFQFDKFRIIGAGLLASAGIVALLIAFTAQQTLSNLIAGFQIAFTQPFRIDDVVIVEGEWGKIEEITLTYVVVRIWDQRRLVLPISYFLTTPFQNWTRTTADILGTIMIYVDYMVPVEKVREEVKRIASTTHLWDGKVVGLQVTDSSERTVTLRALISARNASDAWDLRCYVRERLIDFLQKEYPSSLPRVRIEELEKDPGS